MEHFGRIHDHRPSSVPMQKVVAFALFSTRRQEEITLLRWEDLDGDRILVRDMKHPGDKKGNDVYCELPPEALKVIQSMPRGEDRIFPFSTDAISASFTRACKFLGIQDLRFHDLRHEGISRLFEIGRTIPQAAAVSGHRSWTSLKRYTHIRQSGQIRQLEMGLPQYLKCFGLTYKSAYARVWRRASKIAANRLLTRQSLLA